MLCSALRRFVQMFPLLPTLLMLALFLYSIPTLANLLAAADVNIYVDYITAINVTTQSFEMRTRLPVVASIAIDVCMCVTSQAPPEPPQSDTRKLL